MTPSEILDEIAKLDRDQFKIVENGIKNHNPIVVPTEETMDAAIDEFVAAMQMFRNGMDDEEWDEIVRLMNEEFIETDYDETGDNFR